MNFNEKLKDLNLKIKELDEQKTTLEKEILIVKKQGTEKLLTSIVSVVLNKSFELTINNFFVGYDSLHECDNMELNFNLIYKKHKYTISVNNNIYESRGEEYKIPKVVIQFNNKRIELNQDQVYDYAKHTYSIPSEKILKIACLIAIHDDLIFDVDDYEEDITTLIEEYYMDKDL